MIEEIRLPEISENVDSGDVINILVNVGDMIEKDQPVVELETDKASFEVPSTVKGKVVEVNIEVGQNVKLGEILIKVDPEGKAEAAAPKAEDKQPVQEKETKAPAPAPTRTPPKPQPQTATTSSAAAASPAVRQLARELGIDISAVPATGQAGRITAEDVKEYARKLITGGPAQAPAAAGPMTRPLPDFSQWGEVERQRVTSIRKKIAETLSFTWSTVPQVTQYDQVDITALEATRKAYVKKTGNRLTVTAIALKVAALALKKFPNVNATYNPQQQEIIFKHYVHISVAVDTDRGLLVPVIRDVDQKSIVELSDELNSLSERTRQHKVTPEEMGGGNFTITNLGGIGGTGFAPIIYWPQTAILGMARGGMQPRVIDGRIEGRMILPLSLSYDHRIIDGVEGLRFLRFIVNTLENPLLLSLD